MKLIIHIARNTTNMIWAILLAVPAIPENPRRAAIIAMTRNVSDQFNMILFFCFLLDSSLLGL